MSHPERDSIGADRVVVLVVDDDPNVVLLFEELLTAPDRVVSFARSGAEGLRALRTVTPAVILLDVNLGDMTGFELAGLVRQNPRLAATPIVFITGYATTDDAMSAGYHLGAVDYLSKPVVPQILQSKVRVFCTLAHQMNEIGRQRDQLQLTEARLSAANAELARLASSDPLTGLLNRRQLLMSLSALREQQARSGRSFGIAVLDLNGFKSVNDTLGHAAGDEVLVAAAERLRLVARPYDLVARLGGDEFCIVIQDVRDEGSLLAVGRRLHATLDAAYTLTVGSAVRTPASIGLVLDRGENESSLARADAAMYRAKESGEGVVLTGVGDQGDLT